jgi:hypothetical protein
MTDDEINKAVNDIRFYWDHLEKRNKEMEAALRKIAEHHVPGVIPDGYTMLPWVAHNYGIMRNIARAALTGEKKDAD